MYAHAATEAQTQAREFLALVNEAILFPLITLMMAIALLVFLYGAFEYVRGANNENSRETGKRHLLYGTIGMLVMLSALSILTIAAATFGLDDELEDATAQSPFETGGFFGSSWNDDASPYSNRSPQNGFDYAGEDRYIPQDEAGTDDAGDATEVSTEVFSGGMDPVFFRFYEQEINDAQQGGETVTLEEIVGMFELPNGEYPQDYKQYENTQLLPACMRAGGDTVFSLSVNNDTSRQFYCIEHR